jgi:uroporphyrinogen III methyltransferase/synthase
MAQEDLDGARVLLITAGDGRDVLPNGLVERGAHLNVVHPYRSRLVTDGPEVDALRSALDAGVDAVTFTSASTVSGFVAQAGQDRAAKVKAVSIGPVTTEAAKAAGITIAAEAKAATIDSLVAAVLSAFGG